MDHRSVGNDSHVGPSPSNGSLADWHNEVIQGKLFLDAAIQEFVLEINNGVRIADRCFDKPLRIVSRRRTYDFETGCVHVVHFGILRMKRAAVDASSARSSHNDGDARAPAVTAFGGEIGDLVESAGNEIGELHFGDGTHSHEGRTNGGPHDPGFRYRCIDDAPLTKPFQHSGGDFEGTAIYTDVFAENEHTFILFHFFPDALTNCFDVGGQGHMDGNSGSDGVGDAGTHLLPELSPV